MDADCRDKRGAGGIAAWLMHCRSVVRAHEAQRAHIILRVGGRLMGPLVVAAVLSPGGIIAWLIVGAIAGALAGRVMSDGGYGVLGDIVVGIIGAFIGGFIVSLFTNKSFGLIGSIIVAFIGACVMLEWTSLPRPTVRTRCGPREYTRDRKGLAALQRRQLPGYFRGGRHAVA
jgi:uncharacterized membrane protein YeaQ/YmgE (transglycosylase-associated protein family)